MFTDQREVENMTLPNLVGCGAGKSGTTSLHYYLSQHPQIFMAPVKETHYFSKNYDKGESWYRSNFEGCTSESIIGEFSTTYMNYPAVPARIAELIPQANLMFLLRNPIERAYSNYWFSVSIGQQAPDRTFSDVIRTQKGNQLYVSPGFYYDLLSGFLRYFDRNQIYILITEELKKEPMQQMSSCYQYLGIDPSFVPNLNQKFNVTVTTSNKWKQKGDQNWLVVKRAIRPFFLRFPTSIRRRLSKIEQLFRLQMFNEERPPILEEDRDYLANIYQEHNIKLANFMERALPWE